MDRDRDALQTIIETYQPYFYELRKHLIVSGILFVIGSVIGLLLSSQFLTLILKFYQFKGISIITTSPYQFIDISFSIAFMAGVFLASPYAMFRLYYFVKPALKRSERRFIISFLPLSFGLFAAGFSFGLWLMQLVINFYSQINSGFAMNSFWDVQRFLSQIFFTSFLTGFVFQIPIIMSALIRLHLVSYSQFASKRKVIYAGLFVVAVILPTTDLLSLVLETLPLFFLFEIGLLLNRKKSKKPQ